MSTTDNALDESVLRDSASAFCAKSAPVARLRALRGGEPAYSEILWQEMVELGWTAILVPERAGGLGLDLRAMAVVLRELGRVAAPEPLLEFAGLSALVLGALDNVAADVLAEQIAQGAALVATAWQGHAREPRVEWASLQASDHLGGHLLNGCKFGVAHADSATHLVVPALFAQAPSLWVVAANAPGLTRRTQLLSDGSTLTEFDFNNVQLTRAALLASGPLAEAALDRALDGTAILAASYLAGLARETLDITLQYLKTRSQFGRLIGAFQALQHRAVNLFIHTQITDAVVDEASHGWATATRRADQIHLASRAKHRASDTAQRVTRDAIQMHGGIGFTDDCNVGLYLNRALAIGAAFGNATWHARRLGQQGDRHSTDSTPRQLAVEPQDGDWNQLSDEDFRSIIRHWFEREYPADMRFTPRRMHWHEVRDWYQKLVARGWAAPGWPREYGGMGLTPAKLLVFMEEQERWGIARTPDMGVIMVGPLLIRHGTPEQRAHYLPKSLSGEYIWCQGYSEPNAGSDLASLRMEAVVDGTDFVVNGQKIWTTLAQDASHIFLLVRTDKQAKKQAGISFLLADMQSPGITVRPIRNLAGHEEFCEVFFDNVRVPQVNLVGAPNHGWTMAKALLSFERIFLGSPKQCQYALRRVGEAASHSGLLEDPAFLERYTKLKLDVFDLETIYACYADQVKRGETLGPDVSMLKVWATETFAALTELVIEAAGSQGAVVDKALFGTAEVEFMSLFYNARPATIYGGSNEIQRNIIAKAVLSLPDA